MFTVIVRSTHIFFFKRMQGNFWSATANRKANHFGPCSAEWTFLRCCACPTMKSGPWYKTIQPKDTFATYKIPNYLKVASFWEQRKFLQTKPFVKSAMVSYYCIMSRKKHARGALSEGTRARTHKTLNPKLFLVPFNCNSFFCSASYNSHPSWWLMGKFPLSRERDEK